jgi:hypothetical protein
MHRKTTSYCTYLAWTAGYVGCVFLELLNGLVSNE